MYMLCCLISLYMRYSAESSDILQCHYYYSSQPPDVHAVRPYPCKNPGVALACFLGPGIPPHPEPGHLLQGMVVWSGSEIAAG